MLVSSSFSSIYFCRSRAEKSISSFRIFVQCSASHFRRMPSPSGDRNVLIRLSFFLFYSFLRGPLVLQHGEKGEREDRTCLFRPHYAALHNVKKAPPGRGYEKRVGLGNLSLLLSLFIWFLYISFGLLPFFYTWCGAVP